MCYLEFYEIASTAVVILFRAASRFKRCVITCKNSSIFVVFLWQWAGHSEYEDWADTR